MATSSRAPVLDLDPPASRYTSGLTGIEALHGFAADDTPVLRRPRPEPTARMLMLRTAGSGYPNVNTDHQWLLQDDHGASSAKSTLDPNRRCQENILPSRPADQGVHKISAGFRPETRNSITSTLVLASTRMDSPNVSPLYTFRSAFIENLHVLPDGRLLLSALDPTVLLAVLDPEAVDRVPELVTGFDPLVTGLTGIVSLPDDGHYGIGGGTHTRFAFERGSMFLFIVSVELGEVVDRIPVPGTASLNGMATLPNHPHVVVGADSTDGRILAIDTHTREVSILLQNAALGPSSGFPPIGINGLRAREGHLYFTNSGQGTFGRIRIAAEGNVAGEVEILNESPAQGQIYDDFTFDLHGNAYVAAHSSSVVRIAPDGTRTTIASGDGESSLAEPTSAALALDGRSIFVSTGGPFGAGRSEGGQIVRIPLP